MFPDMAQPPPQHKRPLWIAAVATGAAVPVMLIGMAMILDAVFRRSLTLDSLLGGLAAMATLMAVGAVLMLLIALPVARWLRGLRRLSWMNLCAAGGIAGLCVAALFFLLDYPSMYSSVFVVGLVTGIVLALVFALIAGVRPRSPRS